MRPFSAAISRRKQHSFPHHLERRGFSEGLRVDDMHCEASRVLIRWDQSPDSPVRYRCPRGYMLNRHASMPFMPWPDYSKGYNADLAVALHGMLKDTPEQ